MRQLVYTSFLIIITLLSFWCSHCQLEQISRFFLVLSFPSLRLNLFPNLDGIFLFKWIKETPTQVCEICSKLSIKLTLSLVSDRFQIFLRFPDFLRSEVLSLPATHEATRIYQFSNNNHALLNHQEVSKCHEHNCLQNFLCFYVFAKRLQLSYFGWNLLYLSKKTS